MILTTGSSRKVPEITGTCKQYFAQNFLGFFPMDYYQYLVLSGWKSLEKLQKISGRNYPELAVSGSDCLTWEAEDIGLNRKKELANGLKIGLAWTEIDGELMVRSFFYES